MTIVATGPVLAAALKAAESLKAKNIRCRVVKLSRLKPIDEIALMETILPGRPVLSVEEHIGGASLALPLSDILLRNGNCPAFGKLCIPDAFPHECMSHRKLLEWSGLDEASIAAECERLVRGG
jgi:transketolase